MTPSVVRLAGPADRSEVIRLLLLGHIENGLFPMDREKAEWFIDRMLNPGLIPGWDTGPRGAIGVIGEPNRLEGLAFVVIGCYWYTTRRHLEEYIIFVDPGCRRTEDGEPVPHAKALLEWLKEQSRLTGLPLLAGILSQKPRMEAKVRLYQRTLPKAGAFFCFDPSLTATSSSALVIH
jgi:hypothetical protein